MATLSPQQQSVLDDIEAADDTGIFIDNGSMRQRSAEALFDKGLVGRGFGTPGTSFYFAVTHPESPIPDPPEGWVAPTD